MPVAGCSGKETPVGDANPSTLRAKIKKTSGQPAQNMGRLRVEVFYFE